MTSNLDKIKLALESVSKIAKEAADTGELRAKQETVDKRYDICLSCEEFNDDNRKCRLCGCYMDLKIKLKATRCPINKWREDE